MTPLPVGKARLLRRGKKIAILAFGSMVKPSLDAANALDATVADMRFVKPLDDALVRELAESHTLLVTVEEAAIMGGAGSAVAESLHRQNIVVPILHLGLPDTFIDHGDPQQMLAAAGLNKEGMIASIRAIQIKAVQIKAEIVD